LENISLRRIEKSPFSRLRKGKARLTILQPATQNSKEGNEKQITKDQETKTTRSSMNSRNLQNTKEPTASGKKAL
jgi:hypothetical protein